MREVLAEAAYQRCYVHFLRNALDYVPRRVDDDCLQELRWLYDRRDLAEARRDQAAPQRLRRLPDPQRDALTAPPGTETLTRNECRLCNALSSHARKRRSRANCCGLTGIEIPAFERVEELAALG